MKVATWSEVGAMAAAAVAASVQLCRAPSPPAPQRSIAAPSTARLRGIVTDLGRPVANARIAATVLPTGHHWTVARATSGANGTFSLAIPSEFPDECLSVALELAADGKRGYARVHVGPGHRLVAVELEVSDRAVRRDR